MFYKPKFFSIEELVDEVTYSRFGDRALMFLNPVLLRANDRVRNYFNAPMTINNWHIGGQFSQRGLRVNTSVGADYSQHKFGNASDYDIEGYSADEIRAEIAAKPDHHAFELITCIEIGVNWVHHDCRNISNRIMLIRP